LLADAQTPEHRYRLLHPSIADHDAVRPFWTSTANRAARRNAEKPVRRRLQFDLALEFGLTGQVGRTLAMTGNAAASVLLTDQESAAVSAPALEVLTADGDLFTEQHADEARLWVRGILERIRQRGAIAHHWF